MACDVLFVDANVPQDTGADAGVSKLMRWFYACGAWQTPFKEEWKEVVAEN
jgi:hypothetical protein